MSKNQPSSENPDSEKPPEAAGLMGMLRGVVGSEWLGAPTPESQDAAKQADDSPRVERPPAGQPAAAKPRAANELKIRCPHCHNPIEVLNDAPSGDVSCPSCGSSFNLAKDAATGRYLDSGKMLGHFQLLDRLGQGAFGEVWKARDKELDRLIAIKIPRREHLTDQEAEQFLREARAAAQVRHPNIVSVYEVGREQGQIYIASDFIDGATLSEWIEAHPLTVRESVELCATVADALHHAHEAGVVHRDLKPQNILVRMDQGFIQARRASEGLNAPVLTDPSLARRASESLTPFITDFGLAKRDVGEITMTVEGAILGTPAYMSPEQARGEAHHADRRSDVYSLGVILFRLLTGELPFRGQRQMLLVQILSEEPPALRKLDARLPRDVETICLKCLEKDPTRRYPSAAALAADLRRWLTGHPIQARPVSRTERAWRWCHRNPAVASLSAAVVLVLLTGMTVSSFFASQSANETKRANKKTDEALTNLKKVQIEKDRADTNAATAMFKAEEAEREKNRANTELKKTQQGLLATYSKAVHRDWKRGDREVLSYLNVIVGDQGVGFEWEYLRRLAKQLNESEAKDLARDVEGTAFRVHDASVTQVIFSPSGGRLATASADMTVKVWDSQTLKPLHTLNGHTAVVTWVEYSPNSKWLATSSRDGIVRVWDQESGTIHTTFDKHADRVECLAFNPTSDRLAFGGRDGVVRICDTQSGKVCLELAGDDEGVFAVRFNPNGKTVAFGGGSGRVTLWDAITGAPLAATWKDQEVRSLAISPDGRHIAIGGYHQLVVTDAISCEDRFFGIGTQSLSVPKLFERAAGLGVEAMRLSVAFTPDSTRLATGSPDSVVKIWNVNSGHEVMEFDGHTSVTSVAFSPDGFRLAAAYVDGMVRVWDARQ